MIWGGNNCYNLGMSLANTVLMISPDKFGFNPETAGTNSFQHKSNLSQSKLRSLAMAEFKNMVEKLENEKIRVLILGSRVDVVTPDAVFPNNWFSHHKDGRLVLYPMLAENRRQERQLHNLKSLLNDAGINHLKVMDFSKDEKHQRILEGTGSLVLDRGHRVAFAMESLRTSREEFEKWCMEMKYEGVFFHAFDRNHRPIYHTNVIMSIGDKFAVVCFDAVSDQREAIKVESKLNSLGKEIIPITVNQMDKFCGNILQLKSKTGDSRILMSDTSYKAFTPKQRSQLKKYGKIITVSIPTIENVGGGSARCMITEIFG